MSDEKIPPIVSPPTPAPQAAVPPVRPDRVGRASDADERDRRSREAPPRYLKDNDTPFALAWRVLTSRYRSMRDKAGRDFHAAHFAHRYFGAHFSPEPGATGLRSKNLQYLEESIAQWVMSRDVLVFMIPTVNTSGLLHPSNITLRHYARHLDGLVLQGGADVSPQTYWKRPPVPNGAATARATCMSWNCCTNSSMRANRCWAFAVAAS